MIDINAFSKINPNDDFIPFKKDSFELFAERARDFLPNFPDDVLDQWPYEAFQIFLNGIEKGMQYEKYTFREESWNIKQILQIIDINRFYESGIGTQILDGSLDTRLIQYMKEHGTWPRPIIVYDTARSKPEGCYQYSRPYQLLEGHLRLVYLRRLVEAGISVPQYHSIWVVTQ